MMRSGRAGAHRSMPGMGVSTVGRAIRRRLSHRRSSSADADPIRIGWLRVARRSHYRAPRPAPRVEVLPAAAAASGAPAVPAVPVPPLYRHGVEVTVQGSFLTLIPYMHALEKESDSIFWSLVKMDVVGYPDVLLKITIYTLSTQPQLPVG